MSDSTGEEQLGNKKSADKRMEEPITSYQQGESVYKIGGKFWRLIVYNQCNVKSFYTPR